MARPDGEGPATTASTLGTPMSPRASNTGNPFSGRRREAPERTTMAENSFAPESL